jgi:hypothetical protein
MLTDILLSVWWVFWWVVLLCLLLWPVAQACLWVHLHRPHWLNRRDKDGHP